MCWHESIYIEGGPQWENDCSGRGDFELIQPNDVIFLYPSPNSGPHTYIRTTRTWISPIFGTIHTVFEHVGPTGLTFQGIYGKIQYV